jgi:hypothetical protein
MKTIRASVGILGLLVTAFFFIIGCESSDTTTSAHVGMYYGASYYDPWYYGPDYYPPGVIVTPPPGNPDSTPRPSHPIALPPTSTPRPTPTPSIPSRPRASFRR